LDEECLRAAMLCSLRGDAAAYRELLALLAGELRTFFRRRIALPAHEIEDLVQETLLAIHAKRETYDVEQPLTNWLFAIARHKLIDRYRRQGSRAMIALDDIPEPTSESDLEGQMAGRDVATALAQLPAKQAAAIRCVKLEGLSVEETAIATGQSISAVKVSIHRGLKKLLCRFARGE
jgi:RNA polymerase sigma-70 factor (ECF subfamily)